MSVSIQDIPYVNLDMSMLPMFILYNIQHMVVEEIKAHEHFIYDQLKQSKNRVTTLETKLADQDKQTEELW